MKKWWILAVLVLAIFLLSGCYGVFRGARRTVEVESYHAHGHGCGHVYDSCIGWVREEPIVVYHGHICSFSCSHYYSGSRWVVVFGHRHGPGCGHTLRGRVWIAAY